MQSDIITAEFSDRIPTFLKRLGRSGWGRGGKKICHFFVANPKI